MRKDHAIDRQLGVLFDNTNEFKICMLDRAGRIIGWNASAEKMTGYMSCEVLGKNYSSFISNEEKNRKVLTKALASAARSGSYTAEGIRVRKDGSHFWAQTFITPMKELGSIKFFVLITRDVTKERAAEQKREEYIGIASHELKNPITTLSLYSEILAKRLELDRDKKNLRVLRDIQGQAARLSALLDDLLLVGKIEGGRLLLRQEVFNPNPLINKIMRDIQNRTSSHRIVCTGSLSHPVRAEKARIAQVFTYLLTNAIKYSPGANKVVVRIRSHNKKCVISVQDFGLGISKTEQREIFTRYFRSKNAEAGNITGSGLGLYISKQIIQKHRERLWVESVEGKGSTFFFTLSFA